MKSRESWYVKSIRFFYGIRDNIDEYRMQEINRIGNNSFMMLATYVFIMNMVDIFLQSLIGFKMTLIITIFINWLALFIILIYEGQTMQKLNLDQIVAYDEHDYENWVKKTKLRSILLAAVFFVFFRITAIGVDLITGISFLHALLSLSENLLGLFITIINGIGIYHNMKKKIKK